jgi:basic membrane lipoprotein Med (substrate-binding protein (PBP1-ABC) superfamily)
MMSAGETVVSAQPLKVAMLLGRGGRGDKSFNDSAYAGFESAGVTFAQSEAKSLFGLKTDKVS